MSSDGAQPGEVNRLQRWFQAVITHADGVEAGAGSEEAQRLFALGPKALEKVITRSRALSAAERMAIYANAYHTRLLECLGEVFPMLKRALGEEVFGGFAFGYLQQFPSRSYTLNELGRHFPGYLESTRPGAEAAQAGPAAETVLDADWPEFLIDLARLEWAFYEIFDGPGVEGQPLLEAGQLLDLDPRCWSQSVLEPVPCLQLLETRFPVNDYYSAIRQAQEGENVPIPGRAKAYVALSRRQFVVRRYNLSRVEFEVLGAIKAGKTVGQAIERVAQAESGDVDALAGKLTLWFHNWAAEGFFRAVRQEQ